MNPAIRPAPSGSRLGFEIKYPVDLWRVDIIRAWLTTVCRRDPQHPEGFVNSIYFDTPTLRYINEKINSDYFKTKVRLRWYEVPGHSSSSAFLEAKFRIGTRREKLRLPVPLDGLALSHLQLDHPTLRELPSRLRPLGVPVSPLLQPVLVVRYRRDRFVTPETGTRVSLDAQITVPKVNHGLLAAANPSPLQTAVVEIKGADPDLPPVLRHLVDFGGRKASFSKYLACYDHVVNPTG